MTFFLVPLGIFFDYIAMAVARIEYILIKSCPVFIDDVSVFSQLEEVQIN